MNKAESLTKDQTIQESTFASKNGVSSKELIYQEDKICLYHYLPKVKKTISAPLLITFSLVNRPYIMDLTEDCTLIGELLQKGVDIYLIDWGYPDAEDKNLSLSHYICGYLHTCISIIKKISQQKINLLGVCQGGVLCLAYCSLYPNNIKNLITLVTPVDFHTRDNIVSQLLKTIDIDLMVDTMGNIPGVWLTQLFMSLKPFYLMGKKYLDFIDKKDNAKEANKFFAMEKWIYDNPDQAGLAFKEFVKGCYQENSLIKNKIRLEKKTINLMNIKTPLLNITATNDHIVPPSASSILNKYTASSDYHYVMFPGGHTGLYVSDKTRAQVTTSIANWLVTH